MTPGELDLTTGALPLATTIAENGAELLSTNIWIKDEASLLGQAVVWLETDYGDVAVLSALNPLDENELAAARRGHDSELSIIDAAHSLSLVLPDVVDRASFVVLLAHGPIDWARTLVGQVDGIDLCVVAHDAFDPREFEMVGNTAFLKTGRNGEFVIRFRVYLASNGEVTFGGSLVAVTESNYEEREDVLELVGALDERFQEAQTRLNTANPGAAHSSGAEYLGFSSCGECHGEQTDSWYGSRHVGSRQTLSRIGWHIEPDCFECHTTGFGFATGFESHQRSPSLSGVTCEACHGPASLYVQRMRDMGEGDVSDVDESVCRGCHTADRDPEFDFSSDLINAGLSEDGHL